MPTGRYYLSAAAADGVIHTMGGYKGSYSDEHEVYDPVSDSWETRISLLTPRIFMAAATIDSSVYIIGGTTTDNETDMNEVYHPPLYVYRKD